MAHTNNMDWKLFASTLMAIFFAELGDKTQLATLSLSAGSASRWSIFLGSAVALVLSSALAVLLGDIVSRYIPAGWLHRAAGGVFIILGLLYLFGSHD